MTQSLKEVEQRIAAYTTAIQKLEALTTELQQSTHDRHPLLALTMARDELTSLQESHRSLAMRIKLLEK